MMDPDKELDHLFEEARSQQKLVSDDLMARVLSDAREVQLGRISEQGAGQREPSHRRLWSFVGGWTSAVSFATCAAAGVYLGYLAPDLVNASNLMDVSYADALLQDLTFLTEGL